MDEILKCDHPNESPSAVTLSGGAVCVVIYMRSHKYIFFFNGNFVQFKTCRRALVLSSTNQGTTKAIYLPHPAVLKEKKSFKSSGED